MQPRSNSVALLIKRVHNAFKRQLDQNPTEPCLTQAQCDVLLMLHRAEAEGRKVYPSDLENALHLSRPTVSGLLQRLEAKGFITARPDPADKRFKQLKATELSRQHRAEVHRHLIAQEETMLAGFTPEETEQLRGLLKRLLHNLEGCPVSSAEDIKTHTNGGDAHA